MLTDKYDEIYIRLKTLVKQNFKNLIKLENYTYSHGSEQSISLHQFPQIDL